MFFSFSFPLISHILPADVSSLLVNLTYFTSAFFSNVVLRFYLWLCLLIFYICSVALFFWWSLVIVHILLFLFTSFLYYLCVDPVPASFFMISYLWMGRFSCRDQLFSGDLSSAGAKIGFCMSKFSHSTRQDSLIGRVIGLNCWGLLLLPRKQRSTAARLPPSQGVLSQASRFPETTWSAHVSVLWNGWQGCSGYPANPFLAAERSVLDLPSVYYTSLWEAFVLTLF